MNLYDYKDFIGYIAAVLTTVAFVPQVLHTWRTRSVDDVS
ncbi:MAG: PQ-loop repeat-containing protein, partial [Rhodocyclaceae bacterium]